MPLVIRTTGFEQYLDKTGGAYIRALVLGTTGAGKTPSAAMWPKPIFANCEQGLMSIASLKIPYADITSSEDMDALIKALKMECLKPAERRQYATLVVDTFDAYQRKIIQQRLRAEHKEALSGWADWGWLDGKMSQFVEAITSLPMNVVVNLHTKDVTEGEGDDRTLVKAARLKGDIKDAIFQDFDLIGLMETYYQADKGERVMKRHIRWQPEPRFPFLRDRSNRLPQFTDVDFTPADYSRILDAVTSDIEGIPESTVVETLATEADDVPSADTPGGPVNVDKQMPTKKVAAAKKTAAKKPAATKVASATGQVPDEPVTPAAPISEPTPAEQQEAPPAAPEPAETPRETATPVEDAPTEPAAAAAAPAPTAESVKAKVEAEREAAVATVEERLGGEVISEEADAGVDPSSRCGYQPESHKNFQQGHPGCGKDLSGENIAKVNLALLRAKAKLCSSCLDDWKRQSAA